MPRVSGSRTSSWISTARPRFRIGAAIGLLVICARTAIVKAMTAATRLRRMARMDPPLKSWAGSVPAGEVVDDFVRKAHEPVNLRLENSLLIAVGAEPFRTIFQIGCG